MIRSEHIPCFLRRALENDDHEGTHEECPVDHLVRLVRRAVVEDTIVRVVLVSQQSGQLS